MSDFSDQVFMSGENSHHPDLPVSNPCRGPDTLDLDDASVEISTPVDAAEWILTVPIDEMLLADLTSDHRFRAWSLLRQHEKEKNVLQVQSETERLALVERNKTERKLLSRLLNILAASLFSSGALIGLAAWYGVEIDAFSMWAQTAIATQIGLIGAAGVFYKRRSDSSGPPRD